MTGTDAENATALAARLAAADAPDATMYFIDCVDAAGHSSGYYPMSSAYLSAAATAAPIPAGPPPQITTS